MRITIVIDDPDATAATEAATTISRIFTGSTSTSTSPGGRRSTNAPDDDGGAAPRIDMGIDSGPGRSGASGNGSGPVSPAAPSPSAPTPASPAGPGTGSGLGGESAGPAPELGGD